MAQNLTYDLDSFGGNGGLGSGTNPLLWLITLAFLRGDNGLIGGQGSGAGAGAALDNANNNGETQAKLDCLQQQHAQLAAQISEQTTGSRFSALSAEIQGLASTARDVAAVQANQINDFRSENAQQHCQIQKDIAMQTATLTAEGLKNTQSILDSLNNNALAGKDAEIRRLQDQLQTQTILCQQPQQQQSPANNIDINLILRALQGQGQAQGAQFVPVPVTVPTTVTNNGNGSSS